MIGRMAGRSELRNPNAKPAPRKRAAGAVREAANARSRAGIGGVPRADGGGVGAGSEPGSGAAANALWVGLGILVAGRAVAAWLPWRGLWGLDVQRFLAPGLAWGTWALLAVALLPAAGRVLSRPFEWFGERIERSPWLAALGLAAIAAALVAAFPDRLHFVGDFLMRIGAVRKEESPDILSPQAFPLDLLVHYALPLGLDRLGWMTSDGAVRAIGAGGAALLAIAAVALARTLDGGPAARAAACTVALFGGLLCLYTGESKAFGELVVIVVAFAACGLAALRREAPVGDGRDAGGGRGAGAIMGAGLCVAVGVLFHRLAIGLIPAWLVLVIVWLRADGRRVLRSVTALLAIAIPGVVLAVMAPRLTATIATYDLGANFASAEARASGGMFAAAFRPARLLDVLDLLLFLSPLAIVALWVGLSGIRRSPGSVDRTGATHAAAHGDPWRGCFLAALVVPFALLMLFARPPQGTLRDWDSFATSAAACSVAAAWTIARVIERSRRTWLVAAVALGVIVPAVQWLAHYSDAGRGRARLEALMTGPPERPAIDRARTWDFLGWRYFREQNYDASVRAFEEASAAAPSPSNLTHWAMAETMRGHLDLALGIYSRAVARDSNYTLGWFGVGVSAINSGDRAAAERAARALQRLAPGNPKTREIMTWLGRGRS